MRISTAMRSLAAAALLAGALTAATAGPAAAAPKPVCGWTSVPGPGAPNQLVDMDSVNAIAKDDIRLGGFSYYPGPFQPWLLQSDGRSVTEGPPVPLAPLTGYAGLSTSFASAGEGWTLLALSDFGAGATAAARWHDSRWTVTPTAVSPEPETKFVALQAVTAVSATDAWAFGYLAEYANPLSPSNAVIEHWDGTSWAMVPNPTQTRAGTYLRGAAVLSPSDIWAVGVQSDDSGTVAPLIEHWDGAAWKVVDTPTGNPPAAFYSVSAAGPNDVWAVGAQTQQGTTNLAVPLVEHWNGSAWSEVRGLPDVGNARVDKVFAAAAGDVWAIVEVPRGADRFLHWDGTAWRVVPAPGPQAFGLRYFYGGIGGTGPGDIWAVGEVTNSTTATGIVQIAHYSCRS